MLKVGLTGGYASGKSFVAAELARLGCHVIYADELGHQVLLPEGEAYQPTIGVFGREILAVDGSIDRKKLGAIVFRSAELLAKLNNIVHPAVFRLEETMFARFAEADPQGISVLEAAILVETGRYKHFDKLILTVCSVETQITRGMERDGLTREQIVERLTNQSTVEEKKRFVSFVIDTDSAEHETAEQVREIFTELRRVAAEHK